MKGVKGVKGVKVCFLLETVAKQGNEITRNYQKIIILGYKEDNYDLIITYSENP